MPIANCANCKKRFRKNEFTGDLCRFCKSELREAELEAAAMSRMTIAVFGTDDPDELVRQDKAKEQAA